MYLINIHGSFPLLWSWMWNAGMIFLVILEEVKIEVRGTLHPLWSMYTPIYTSKLVDHLSEGYTGEKNLIHCPFIFSNNHVFFCVVKEHYFNLHIHLQWALDNCPVS